MVSNEATVLLNISLRGWGGEKILQFKIELAKMGCAAFVAIAMVKL